MQPIITVPSCYLFMSLIPLHVFLLFRVASWFVKIWNFYESKLPVIHLQCFSVHYNHPWPHDVCPLFYIIFLCYLSCFGNGMSFVAQYNRNTHTNINYINSPRLKSISDKGSVVFSEIFNILVKMNIFVLVSVLLVLPTWINRLVRLCCCQFDLIPNLLVLPKSCWACCPDNMSALSDLHRKRLFLWVSVNTDRF